VALGFDPLYSSSRPAEGPFSMSGNDMDVNLKVTHGVAIAHTETTPQAHLGNTLLAIRDAVTKAARGIFAVI